MKKRFRFLAAVLAAVMLTAAALSGCGASGPTEDDAKNYVQALLDLMCTGSYDGTVQFADIEEGKEQEMRDQMIDEIVASISEQAGMTGEIQERFRSFVDRAFSKCSFAVGEAVKTEEDKKTGYDVTVTIEPLRAFDGASEAMQEEIANLTADVDRLMKMTEEEMYEDIYAALFDHLEENLNDPSYDEPVELVVHYGIVDEENKVYGVSSEDSEKIGSALFSSEGLELE